MKIKKSGIFNSASSLNKLWNTRVLSKWTKINGVFLKNNLPECNSIEKIKDGAHIINLGEYADVGTHWITLFCNKNEIVHFDSFCVEHIPKEIKEFIDRHSQNKNIIANIFQVKANDSVMCVYFCIEFIDFMLAGEKLTDYTHLFSPYDLKKSDDIILSYFKN